MANSVPQISALADVYAEGVFGAEHADGPGLTVQERTGRVLYHISGDLEGAEFPTAARHALGVPLPMSVHETRDGGGVRVLWLGPDRWLAVCAEAPDLSQLAPHAAINDVTGGRLVLRVSGAMGRELLAKGCPLDLHASAFKPGHCAQTLMGQVTVVIDCVGEDSFDLYVNRSCALFFWEWFARAAAEFGYRVLSAE